MIADCAIYLYQQTHDEDYLYYAVGTYEWTKKYLKHPTRGYYYCELDIASRINGRPDRRGHRGISDGRKVEHSGKAEPGQQPGGGDVERD